MQTIVDSGLRLVTENRTFCDARGFRVRRVQRRNGKTSSMELIVRDRAGRPIEIWAVGHTSLRYGEHGELLRRDDELLEWRGRFFDVAGALDPRGESWSQYGMPRDLAKAARVGFTGEVIGTYGPSSFVDKYVYDDHARLVSATEHDATTRYTWNERGQLVLSESGDDATIYRYNGDALSETITTHHGIEMIGVRYENDRPVEGRTYGRVVEHSTWSSPCAQ